MESIRLKPVISEKTNLLFSNELVSVFLFEAFKSTSLEKNKLFSIEILESASVLGRFLHLVRRLGSLFQKTLQPFPDCFVYLQTEY